MESCNNNNNNALDSPTGRVGGCCEQFLGNNSQQHRSLENKNVGHRFMMHEPFVKTYQNASKPSKGDRWRNFLIRKQILKLQRQSRLDKDAFVKKVQEIFANNKTALTTSVPTSPIVITLSPAVDTTRPPAPAPRTKAEKRIITRFKLFEDSPWNVFLTKHYYGDTEGYGIGIESSKS